MDMDNVHLNAHEIITACEQNRWEDAKTLYRQSEARLSTTVLTCETDNMYKTAFLCACKAGNLEFMTWLCSIENVRAKLESKVSLFEDVCMYGTFESVQ